jgi:hypothetical protein
MHSVPKSQGSKLNAPDDTPNDQHLYITINHNSNNNMIKGETLQPAPPSILQMHATVELVMVDT